MRESGIGLTLLFNELNTIRIDFQRLCRLVQKKRLKGHEEYIRGRIVLYDRASKERLLTGRQGDRILWQGDALKATIFFEFTGDSSANVHGNNVLDEHEVGQFSCAELMLFDDDVVPVRGGAGEDNAGEWIIAQNIAVGCPYKRNPG